MKSIIKHTYILLLLLFLASCSNSDSIDKDEEKPTITINYDDGFPVACTQLSRGQTYTFKAMITDNKALASYSINVHHNFDHHTHDDQEEPCELEALKTAVNPFIFIENHTIEDAPTAYEIELSITIPNDIDTGDYHCAYSVTDETGWQARTSVDIKIIN
ncbi:DUF4625 domain-containing protein [Formosa undariae]|uniref:DUF4625 domain-containing protein n=1 Tax=Formosa undariae TaxID=1325436 RepID=A0ABV5F309_9FLAO